MQRCQILACILQIIFKKVKRNLHHILNIGKASHNS